MLNSGGTFEIGNSEITINYSKSLVKEQKKKKNIVRKQTKRTVRYLKHRR